MLPSHVTIFETQANSGHYMVQNRYYNLIIVYKEQRCLTQKPDRHSNNNGSMFEIKLLDNLQRARTNYGQLIVQ